MAIDWAQISTIADETGRDVLRIVKPYLPALAREGKEVFEGFVRHLWDQDWAQIDALMYAKMTLEERRELEADVYKDAHAAVLAKFTRKELARELLFKAVMSLIIKVL